MKYMTYFYVAIDILLVVYACYSGRHGRHRERRHYIEKGDPGLSVFLALFILISIVDGFSGFSKKRMVVSGYFKRTVKYDDLASVTLIQIPNQEKPLVMAIFRTSDGKAYMMRFNNEVNSVIKQLQEYAGREIPVEVQSMM